ncbi:MAG: acetolactate synthase large subunit, partial [Desulfovibrionaceae bacterium]|nr:acetolactate synthase large subunit [Desulfovibrionaceae bacterium]
SVDVLAEAQRPLLLAGGGVIMSDAADCLRALAHTLRIPVASTLMGLGGFPGDDELWLGMVGMHGSYAANMAVNHADLVIAVGARFDDRVTGRISGFASHARIVHIDIDPTSIRKNVEVDVPVVGDCRQALEGLLEIAEARVGGKDWQASHADWLATLRGWHDEKPLTYQKNGNIKPQAVVEALYKISNGDAIIATEVGQNQMWAAQFYTFTKPRTLLTSGGLGTMGYGFPAAIGAQFAFPDRLVVDVAGDGSIQMNIQELATAVHNRLPIKILILNNGYLGMVRQWQELFYNRNYCSTNMEAQPDFVKLAEAYGAEGYRIRTMDELESTLSQALASPNPAIIDVHVEREENVYPMVPSGAALDEMLLV